MDRRYITFLLTACTIVMLWQLMNPPAPPVDPKKPDAAAEDGEEGQAGAEGENGNDPNGDEPKDPDREKPADPEIADPEVDSPAYITLGSIDPASPYRLAATFDSRGATIRRLQLSSTKYRDLHDLSGYLGQLELRDDAKGPVVQSITPGSPADKAGMLVDDVVVSIEPAKPSKMKGGPLEEAASLPELLAKSKPGEMVNVTVERAGAKQQLVATLIARPLEIIRPEAENIFLHTSELPSDFEHHPSLEVAIKKVEPANTTKLQLQKANEKLASGVWAVSRTSPDQIEFSKVLPVLGLEVTKRFKIIQVAEEEAGLEAGGYHLEFDVAITNLLDEPQQVQYELQGPNGLPIEGFWYSSKVGRGWSGYGIRDVLLRTYDSTEKDFACRNIAKDKVDPHGDGLSLAYIGVDAQYFAATMIPQKTDPEQRWYTEFTPNLASTLYDEKNSYRQRYQNASFKLTSRSLKLAGKGQEGEKQTHACKLFTGPKHPELLDQYTMPLDADLTLSDFVYYGWFGNIGIPQAMVWILNFFYSFVGNYGLAIFCLTVVVRGCMTPLSRKQAKNMAMMQELKPEIDRIKAKYPEDTQAQMRAQQELFAKHNYNPMGGCLLMFVQLPIFIGLYRALMVDVDLRQAPLISGMHWCSNLAAPDMLVNWSNFLPWPQWFLNGEGIFALGPYLNVLPLVTVALFLLQQKMFMPPPADEQAEMMQKVMKFMMVFMAFMFFKVASGLCLYFIASSLWGIVERKMIPRPEPPAGGSIAKTTTPNNPRDSAASKKQAATKKSAKAGKKKR